MSTEQDKHTHEAFLISCNENTSSLFYERIYYIAFSFRWAENNHIAYGINDCKQTSNLTYRHARHAAEEECTLHSVFLQ